METMSNGTLMLQRTPPVMDMIIGYEMYSNIQTWNTNAKLFFLRSITLMIDPKGRV